MMLERARDDADFTNIALGEVSASGPDYVSVTRYGTDSNVLFRSQRQTSSSSVGTVPAPAPERERVRSRSLYGAGKFGVGRGSMNAPNLALRWDELQAMSYMTKGAMCEIYIAEYHGQKVVVKVPRKDCEDPYVAEHDLEVELDVLRQLNHKSIIRLVGAGVREERPQRFLVLEYLELGTLADKLERGPAAGPNGDSSYAKSIKKTKRYQKFHMVTMLERACELAEALEYLHHDALDAAFVVHRDLKPDNVGFKADGTLKLFDFGLARVVKRRNRVNARYEMTGETGSMRYMAPEVVESLPYNEKVDVYAFGLLLWEMLQHQRVFDGMTVGEFYSRVVNAGARPTLDPAWPLDLRKLVDQCWQPDVDRRPNFHVITDKLREIYNREKTSNKLCLSALNVTEDEHVKIPKGSTLSLVRRATTNTHIVDVPGRAPSGVDTSKHKKKSGLMRTFSKKFGRIFGGGKKECAATLAHTAPELAPRSTSTSITSIPEGDNSSQHTSSLSLTSPDPRTLRPQRRSMSEGVIVGAPSIPGA